MEVNYTEKEDHPMMNNPFVQNLNRVFVIVGLFLFGSLKLKRWLKALYIREIEETSYLIGDDILLLVI